MSRQEDKVIEGVRPHLAPGEEPLVAIIAQPKGTTMAAGAAMGGGQRRAANEAAAGAGLVLSSPMSGASPSPSRPTRPPAATSWRRRSGR
jgi:hypothetical protein